MYIFLYILYKQETLVLYLKKTNASKKASIYGNGTMHGLIDYLLLVCMDKAQPIAASFFAGALRRSSFSFYYSIGTFQPMESF